MPSSLILQGGAAQTRTLVDEITQNGHPFSAGDVIRWDSVSNSYVKALADTATNAEVVGVVETILTSNIFKVVYSGYVDIASFPDAPVLFLSSTTPGGLVGAPPSAVGSVVKPVLTKNTSGKGYIFTNYLGTQIGGSSTISVDEIQPVGTVMPFAGNAIPDTWLLCDGASYSLGDYAELYAKVLYSTGARAPMYGHVVQITLSQAVSGTAVNDYIILNNSATAPTPTAYDMIGRVVEVSGATITVQVLPVYSAGKFTFPNLLVGSGNAIRVFQPNINLTAQRSGAPTVVSATVIAFNTPDLRGRFALGTNGIGLNDDITETDPTFISSLGIYSMGSLGGEEVHALTSAEMPQHAHGAGTLGAASAGNHSHSAGTLSNTTEGSHAHGAGTLGAASAGNHSHSAGTLATATSGNHAHGAGTLGAASAGNHTHGLGTLATTASEGAHTHTVPAGNTTTSIRTGASLQPTVTVITSTSNATTSSAGAHGHGIIGSIAGGGDHSHTITGTVAGAGEHTHTISGSVAADGNHTHTISGSVAADGNHTHTISGSVADGGAHAHTITGSVSAAGSNTPHNNMPPYLAVRYIIKAKPYTRAAIIEGIELPYDNLLVRNLRTRNVGGTNADLLFHVNAEGDSGNGTERMRLGNFLTIKSTASGTGLAGTGVYGGIHFEQNGGNDHSVGMTTTATSSGTQGGILIQGSGNYGTKIHFLTTDAYSQGMKNRMTLDHTGRLGVGTASPTTLLDVNGTAAFNTVGVGTRTPENGVALDIVGQARSSIALADYATANAKTLTTKEYVDSKTSVRKWIRFGGDGTLFARSGTDISVSKTSKGTYTIIHNIGNTNYCAVCTPDSFVAAANPLFTISSITNNSFVVTHKLYVYTSGTSNEDCGFNVLIMV